MNNISASRSKGPDFHYYLQDNGTDTCNNMLEVVKRLDEKNTDTLQDFKPEENKEEIKERIEQFQNAICINFFLINNDE